MIHEDDIQVGAEEMYKNPFHNIFHGFANLHQRSGVALRKNRA